MKEDQKRGLPHCHILLILADDDKPREPQDIDRIVSAEIPDIVTNPRLHDIVTRNNIHGPCGCINQNSPCMSGQGTSRKCEKEFPKKFISDTIVADSTYPQYRRRSPAQGGLQHVKKVRGQYVQFDNSWVVPYNPFLTLKYNAHINVEIVNSVSSVKYIYKYVTKGSDRVTVRLANGEERDITNDEIECFVDARYISASEAYWREYGFSIQHKYPPVDKLPIHLEDEQFVLFQPGDARNIVANGPPTTKLTEFFRLNQESEEQLNITYPDVYKYFRWVSKKWKKRVNIVGRINRDREENEASSDMIGRIPVINLSARQSELFHLRMLLHTVPGPKSYEDLRTFNSVVHPTYQAACLAMGLLDDDSEVDRAMEEAASIRFGPSLREMFALILVFIKPADPVQFWDKHRHLLMEDIMQNNNLTEMNEAVIHTTLLEIQTIVQRHGLDLERDFRFPKPDRELAQQLHQLRILEEEIGYDVTELKKYVETNRPLLNTEQQAVVDMAMDSVENGKGLLISLDAPGGTGKTFVLSLLLAQVRSQKKVALATATSGIAATLLPNGRTLHSRCKVPLSIKDDSMCSISKRDSTGKLIMQCHLMVIDEVSMCDRRILEAIDRTFRDLRDSHRPYGGITMIFSGDWRQILPVVRRGGRADTVAVTLKQSIIWNDVKVMKLKTNMRVRAVNGDEQFAEELLQIGEGRIPVDQELGQFKIKINEEYLINGSNLRCLTDVIYGNLSTLHNDCEWLCSRTILCPTNDAVDEVNDLILRQFPGNQMMYMSSDKILDVENSHQYPVEFLNSICASGMPPHRVCIKKGSPIMLLRNFDPKNGHCNGSRYIVENLMSNVIDARLATGPHAGKRLFIPRIPIVPSENLFPFQMQRRQFPIRLCFAMTANKSQGQTLKKVGIYLKNDFFSHGQLYVAMSRVGSRENVKLFTRNGYVKKKKAAFTNNVVYPEVL